MYKYATDFDCEIIIKTSTDRCNVDPFAKGIHICKREVKYFTDVVYSKVPVTHLWTTGPVQFSE